MMVDVFFYDQACSQYGKNGPFVVTSLHPYATGFLQGMCCKNLSFATKQQASKEMCHWMPSSFEIFLNWWYDT